MNTIECTQVVLILFHINYHSGPDIMPFVDFHRTWTNLNFCCLPIFSFFLEI